MASLPSIATAALLTLAIGAWGVAQSRGAVRAHAYDNASAQEIIAATTQDPAFPQTGRLAVRAAEFFERQVVPPDIPQAERLTAEAIRRDPLRSVLWMNYARLQLGQANFDRARVALERSDVLDPNYPGQRLEAVQLWTILGENDRAERLVAQIAQGADPNLRTGAARSLRVAGRSPVETARLLRAETLDSRGLNQFITAARSTNPKAMQELIDYLIDKVPARESYQRVLAAAAMEPLLPGALGDLWQRISASAGQAAPVLDPDTGILAQNLNLQESPLQAPPFALGWQPLPESERISGTWFAALQGSAEKAAGEPDSGRVVVRIQTTRVKAREDYRWTMLRVLVPKEGKQSGLRVVIPVRAEPVGALDGMLVAGGPGIRESRSKPFSDGRGDWQDLEVILRDVTGPSILDLRLDFVVSSTVQEVKLHLGGPRFEALSAQ